MEKINELVKAIIEKSKNGEYASPHQMSIELLKVVKNENHQNKELDDIRRASIISCLEKLHEGFIKGNIEESLSINKILDKIDSRTVFSDSELLDITSNMFHAESMIQVIEMISFLLDHNILSFVLNNDETAHLSLINAKPNGIEETYIVYDLGDKHVEVPCKNFMQGFIAIFLLNEIILFYEENVSLEAVIENEIIEDLINYTLLEVK